MLRLTPLILESEIEYKIFCDLDGVLVDFVSGYEHFVGKKLGAPTHGKANQDFWNDFKTTLNDKGISEVDFWKNLKWTSDGKQLWNYIKPYHPTILSAPSRNPESKVGKKDWCRNNLGSVQVILDFNKQNYARKNHILIDDRKDFISKWEASGGIGILHTSAANTIKELKKLSL